MATRPAGGILSRMMARKSIAQVQRESASSELKRTLGKWNLLLLGVGCIIGAGIFVRTGSAAAPHARRIARWVRRIVCPTRRVPSHS